jgi:hypothetical protein
MGLSVQCEMRQGCEPWTKVILTDMSRTGFRMAWVPRSKSDPKLWIRIPGLQPLSAMIRWQNQSGIGCEFSSPLYEPVFEHFVRLSVRDLRRSA